MLVQALQQLSLATTFLGANYIAEHAASILGALQPLLGFKVLGTCVPEGKPGAGANIRKGKEKYSKHGFHQSARLELSCVAVAAAAAAAAMQWTAHS
eukprot:1160379-Pelagomonas_calceolata.AAC.12